MRSIFWFLFCCIAGLSALGAREPTVLVSVAPHKYFVDRIANGMVAVQVMVPTGASSHSYEPTPKKMLAASQADIWFMVGEGFEPRVADALKMHNPMMQFVNMRDGVEMIRSEGSCSHCHDANMQDMHIWLSPKEAKVQARTIAKALEERYPEHRDAYEQGLVAFLADLDALDGEIREIFSHPHPHVIMVQHPAYAYFARDYELEQLLIEFEGKDPTPRQMTKIIGKAREEKIKKVYIQPQYSSKGARLIAKEIGAEVVELDPYSEHYMDAMRAIAKQFGSSN